MNTLIVKVEGPVGSGKTSLIYIFEKALKRRGIKSRKNPFKDHELIVEYAPK